MAILNSRKSPIEKFQYLSVIRNTDAHLFYRLFANNITVSRQQSRASHLTLTHIGRKSPLSSILPPSVRLVNAGRNSLPNPKACTYLLKIGAIFDK